jgi:hypothetical protein
LGITSIPALLGLGAVAASSILVKHIFDRRVTRRNPFNYLLAVNQEVDAQEMANDIVSLGLDSGRDRRMLLFDHRARFPRRDWSA